MKQSINRLLSKLGYRVVQYFPLLYHGQELNERTSELSDPI